MNRELDLTGPKYFGTSKKKSCIEEGDKTIPGPGTHSPSKITQVGAPQWKMGSSTNRHTFLDQHLTKIPSPQHYMVVHNAVDKITKKASIPQSTYEPKPNNGNLKNCYEADSILTKTTYPKFSFGYFNEPNYSTVVPGPGTYDPIIPKVTLNRTQSGFSTGERPPPYGQAVKFPGPDKYQTTASPRSTTYSFAKSPKLQEKKEDIPARFYDLLPKKPTVKRGRGQSTEYKREPTFLTVIQSPGPSAYRNDLPQKIPLGMIESSKRRPIQNIEVVDFPSPDKYSSHKTIELNKAQSFIKDSRHLDVAEENTPGPGAYSTLVPVLSKIGGAISKIQQKKIEEQKQSLPGVGAYNPKDVLVRKKAISTVVLRSKRIDFSKTFTGPIGPGEYNISNHFERQLGKMSKSPRSALNSSDKNPGVGNYNIPSMIGQLPKYCTSPKKISQSGFSTFHERLKLQMHKKQGQHKVQIQKQASQVDSSFNPEEIKS